MDWLSYKSDFFTAPASTKYHGNYEGGLLEHSLNVFRNLMLKKETFNVKLTKESATIVGLFHDLCKINFYKKVYNNESLLEYHYEIDDKFPVGHGEKSVFIIQQFMKLTEQEIAMIRWHMLAFDKEFIQNNPAKVYPEIFLIATADLEATYMEQVKGD